MPCVISIVSCKYSYVILYHVCVYSVVYIYIYIIYLYSFYQSGSKLTK